MISMHTSTIHRLTYSILALFGLITVSQAQPIVQLGPDTVLCGSSYLLDAGNPSATSYLWSDGSSSQTLLVTTSGIYWVDVTDGSGMTRDSVEVELVGGLVKPLVTDTAICENTSITRTATSNGDIIIWRNITSGFIAGVGNQLTISPPTTSSYQVESRVFNFPTSGGFINVSGGSFFTITNERGLQFSVTGVTLLESVKLVTNGAKTGNVVVRNGSGSILGTYPVNISGAGIHQVLLGLTLTPGANYRITLANPGGSGQLYIRTGGFNYPIVSGPFSFTSGLPIATHYNAFFDFRYRTLSECTSPLDTFEVVVSPNPVVNLGNDSSFCDVPGFVLDAGTGTGFSYAWNTSATSQTITVSTTGTYQVTVTGPSGCFNSDSIDLVFTNKPDLVLSGNTTVCGPQALTATASTTIGDGILWYSDSLGTAFSSLSPLPIQATTDTTIYARAVQKGGAISVGPAQPSAGAFFNVLNTRGLIFNTSEALFLEQVSIATDGAKSGVLSIKSATGAVLFSDNFNIVGPGVHPVSIGALLPAGTGYQVVLESLIGPGKMLINTAGIFPIAVGAISIVSGTPITAHYNFFTNLIFREVSDCQSDLQSISYTVLESPIIELGADIFLCGSPTATIGVAYPGASYQWSNGSSTAQLQVSTSGTYGVTLSLTNGCSYQDSLRVLFAPAPVVPVLPSDTIICVPNEIAIQAQTTSSSVYWYDQATGGQALGSGFLFSRYVDTTSTFYAESREFSFNESAGLTFANQGNYFLVGNARGLEFQVSEPLILDSVSIYINTPQQGNVLIIREGNDTVFNQNYGLNQPGKNRIVLSRSLHTGSYIILYQPFGGNQGLLINTAASFPVAKSGITILKGTPIAGHYNYFFDWAVRRSEGCASTRSSRAYEVVIPMVLPDEIYSCKDTLVDFSLAGATYLWSDGTMASSNNVTQTDEFWVEISKAGCVLRDTFLVEIPVDAGLPDDGVLCGNVLRTRYDSSAVFLWSTGDTISEILLFAPATISVVVTEPRGCTLLDTIVISGFSDFPVLNLGNDVTDCDSVTLYSGNPGLLHLWSTGETTDTITITSSAVVTLTVTNQFGCATLDTIGIFIPLKTQASFFVPDTVVSSSLTVSFSNTSSFGGYLWDFGDGSTSTSNSPSHQYEFPGNYCVTLIAIDIANNCGNDTAVYCFDLLRHNVSISDQELVDLSIYPNPGNGQIWVRLPSWSGRPVELKLYDLSGRMIQGWQIASWPSQDVPLRIEGVSSGIYHLHGASSGQQWNRMVELLAK